MNHIYFTCVGLFSTIVKILKILRFLRCIKKSFNCKDSVLFFINKVYLKSLNSPSPHEAVLNFKAFRSVCIKN
jgi:hypothetical protein